MLQIRYRKIVGAIVVLWVASCALPRTMSAQPASGFREAITASDLRLAVEKLTDGDLGGRASGTRYAVAAQQYIIDEFRAIGLKPFHWNTIQSFCHQDTIVMRNIMGVVPAKNRSDKYIVVSAHYDHLGSINGKTYPGADDNASGVAALLSIARACQNMHDKGEGPDVNILFVAFDGKEFSMAGSKYFVRHLPVRSTQIVCNLNMDILGSTLVPVGMRPDYMIILGTSSLGDWAQGAIGGINRRHRYNLDLDYTFYGSRDFTRMMGELGDHYSFAGKGIPALLFTSGFHQHTYKPTDRPDIINFDVLETRTRLIFEIILSICSRTA
ncbi:MAG: M28 family peptidase [Bacteroidales bacterium]|nr:M28 family peptidase [Bacteroidales bacterium]